LAGRKIVPRINTISWPRHPCFQDQDYDQNIGGEGKANRPVPQNRKKQAVSYLVFLLICGYAIGGIADDETEVPIIFAPQVKQMLGNPNTVIIDVRRYRNWWRSSKKILTAVREDPSRVNQWIQKYAGDKTLIFYCS
jgi:hypothetical protein